VHADYYLLQHHSPLVEERIVSPSHVVAHKRSCVVDYTSSAYATVREYRPTFKF